MTKKDFEFFIKQELKNKTVEEQLKELEKIKNKYLPDFIQNIKSKNTYCSSCQTWSSNRKFKQTSEIVKNIETTYTDAGYGDDDMYGEVEYLCYYKICPICNTKILQDRKYIRTLWEKTRI